ncbi:FdhF/YdeP family oxidoreductase [Brevifollis gellanilyticus]|uniref:Formate dehydrogenase subunit alpha n=1 Tax=Brevifollis gellanilyticus TaxID=748831 RepID=A0A512M7R6_9BACT|nr:FdhF/YdeP family oxidoreductase [Brevifollis gellanilyticus]GEP42786.1 formate dehydrogenase subunit alpha [Brevifollis gellanilyticus]
MSSPKDISPQPPSKFTGIQVGKTKTSAAGVPAVTNSLKHIYGSAGLLRGTEAMLKLNQWEGFDCPSCAWPDPDDHRSAFEFCENGAKAIASETTKKRVTPEFFEEYSVAELAGWSDYEMDQAGRLTHPMILREGDTHYREISWDDAFNLIGKELNALASPDEGVFYTSGRATNEAAFLYQLFVRNFGTNNLPDCSNMCHESSGAAMNQSVGVGKGTVTLKDLETAETILIIGQNPGTNHPRMLSSLQKAVEGGATIIAVNPMKEAGLTGFMHPQQVKGMIGKATALAKQFLQVKLNGDQALLKGIAKTLIEDRTIDEAFLNTHTKGFETYREHLKSLNWNELESVSGIAKSEIQKAARQCASGERKVITCWAMGLTQHKNAVATIQEVVNIHLMLGALGRDSAGLCPVRGHSNVQGDRTMGVFEKMPEWFMDNLEKAFEFKVPRHHGWDVVNAIKAMHEGPGKVFYALGGNFLQATPDTEYTAEALRRCSLTVHVCTKLNRSHIITGRTGLILPCFGRSEMDWRNGGPQFLTVENSMSVVHQSQGQLDPASPHLLSEPEIVARTAAATLGERSCVDWRWLVEDYDRVRDIIERVVPGFHNFNERVRHQGGFYLPNAARELDWSGIGGKAIIFTHPLACVQPEKDQLLLQTFRSHDQFNTTVYGLNDRYRGIGNERRVIFMNPQDMKDRGISPVTPVDITSHFKGATREAKKFLAIPYDLPAGSTAAYFPEANVLVPIDSYADVSLTPTSKSVVITVKASES